MAEIKTKVRDGTGHEKVKWVVVDKGAGPHYLDCEAYAMAAAFMCGVGRARGAAAGPGARRPRTRRLRRRR